MDDALDGSLPPFAAPTFDLPNCRRGVPLAEHTSKTLGPKRWVSCFELARRQSSISPRRCLVVVPGAVTSRQHRDRSRL